MSQAAASRRRAGPSKGDLREAAILRVARRIFSERPYESVTIDDLARSAGISRTSFYFYFPTKPAVLTALMTQLSDDFAASHVWFDSDGPAPDRLREQLHTAALLWRENAGLLNCSAAAATSNDELRGLLAKAKARYDSRAAEKIARDQAAGSATTAIAANRLAEMVSALRDSRYSRLAHATDDEVQQAVDDLLVAIQRLVYDPV
ncbi:hypothetical protein ACTI_51350 [Actinoplanes sp. OR16]|uniref:TetR/AcrR family transcriptional regulator n=1 Tax=Actinoplanes sp. OR16 TaxID=946334 RepID=UPI000F6F042D|nr:TetR/AcrR family transcriptional regulator [Actinoplanes sp. OR16]BBH68450.1 hypothetical protein ACTI_51350 [Actinoplanes sp. OR16]